MNLTGMERGEDEPGEVELFPGWGDGGRTQLRVSELVWEIGSGGSGGRNPMGAAKPWAEPEDRDRYQGPHRGTQPRCNAFTPLFLHLQTDDPPCTGLSTQHLPFLGCPQLVLRHEKEQ